MMASAAAPLQSQKELEEMLIQSGIELSTPPSSTGELLSLLEKVESELKSIGQDPSVSTRNVLEPIKKALIEGKLLRHSDKIIEVSVASCICEIMRISAPVLPYDNTEMEVVFHQIIASLEKLYYIDSNCYSKALRVLEAVAKYRLCVMLLDFDYVLAVNVFQLFLKIISLKHTNAVLRYMVDIMSQLIEERDEVSLDFQVSILDSLRKKTLATAPCSMLLGKEVLEKCAGRLKPCLLELMTDMNMNLDDYCKVLGSILHEVPEGENMVENAGSVPPVEGTSALQLPQVPLLDATPTMNNNNNNLEPDGSLKALNNRNQAEQLKDTDVLSDRMHKNTKELQQMNLSALSEKIRPDKGHDSFGMNESKRSEEPTNKKEQEKKSWSSLDINATSIVLALPAVTGKQSIPDVLAPSSTNTYINYGSPCKRGQPKKNQTDLTVRRRSERTRSTERKSKEKDSKKLHIIKDYGKELVGAKVKVWWPRDKRFYEGVVSSFNPKMKKHKVIYADDDVEILNLRRERWELLEEVPVKEGRVTD